MFTSPAEKTASIEHTDTIDKPTSIDKTATTEQADTTKEAVTTEKINTTEKTLCPKQSHKTYRKREVIDESDINIILYERNVNGLTLKKIAAIVGISISTISNILKDQALGIRKTLKPRSRMKIIDESDINTILHERNVNGFTLKKITTMTGTSSATVSKILNDHTPSTKKTSKPRKVVKTMDENDCNLILHERSVNRLSIDKIAAMVGTSSATVSKILKTFKENGSLGPIRAIRRRYIINEKDRLEITCVCDHDPFKTMEKLRMDMANPVSKSTLLKMVKKLKLFP